MYLLLSHYVLMSHCGTVSKDFDMNSCLKCCILLLMLIHLKDWLKWVSQKDLCVLLITENLVLFHLILLVSQSIAHYREAAQHLPGINVRPPEFILEDCEEVIYVQIIC